MRTEVLRVPRILVIEDNPPNLELMLYLLRAFGLEAEGSTTGLDGIERARSEPYALFLCDIHLPDLDGVEVARQLRKMFPAVPIVAVTALAMIGDQERLLANGFDGYISKPLDPKTFVPTVQAYMPDLGDKPLTTQPRSSPLSIEHAPTVAGERGQTILVVDDREDSRYLILSVLKVNGFTVIEAGSAEEGIRLAMEKLPSAIICDVNMPGDDGEAFLVKKGTHPGLDKIPVLMITSSDNPSPLTKQKFNDLGAKAFLTRPLNSGDLVAAVGSAIRANGA
jgi:two-component system cell cycle response regulator